MAKRIILRDKIGNRFWVLTPNVSMYNFIKDSKHLTYLEVFYRFGQVLVKPRKGISKSEEARMLQSRKRLLVELNNKVVALKFLAQECRKYGLRLIARKDIKKRVYDYKPYQVFLALCESYLDAVHSTFDCVCDLDKFLGQKFGRAFNKEQWFQIDMDLRNVFHHNQSPLVTVEKGQIVFTIEKLPRKPRFLSQVSPNPHGQYEFSLDPKDLGEDILASLEKWAKTYLDLIDKAESIDAISGFQKDGGAKQRKVTLKDLMKIVTGS